ncbi:MULTISPECIES: oxygen-independent coproporphyrinogen III oxidase [Bradyrhizobium]|uniref:Coproporphyrinogen-III oxidase n=2 Tax=Bradyrhizobium TaxID=374 RepID=A0ABY0QG48_9BRAD|nr:MULTISPECIES: oxygen-independent coproporphyrinogen III oxidase [Bradyrhizobium]SDK26483.1 coproporphyrinogen III oxidase, anaerobic [Bradyrhizobium ottawaense]SEE43444.1 coproporphyrinogen III oxidase, anaerobic [Bradyrhizobium lablabi]SHM42488.1 coproporphyrinogen III oxidase, anaerobic [Bradyrhizobium lablabi]
MNDIVRNYARLQVPRYTSYPTAAEFTTAVGVADQKRWLQGLDTSEAVSVYLHVPYCRELCLYCGCNTKKALRDDVIAGYRVALEREIAQVSDAVPGPVRIARLHWGGGTPSILGAEGLASVMQVLRDRFVFDAGFEHAIELDPRYVTPALAEGLQELGINRASLGVQDVNPLVQVAIGRWQPMQSVEAAVTRLRDAGIRHLNFDLIYGLPVQTTTSLRKTCEIVAALQPDRIACYGYAHMPRLKANQRRIDESTLPGVEERIDQAGIIAEEFLRQGFLKVGIDHFARPGDLLARAAAAGGLHRNFQGYTDDGRETLIGFGASSISRFRDGYVQNVSDVPSYVRAITGGALAPARGCRLDAAERQRARTIESLMCQFQADLDVTAPDLAFDEELPLLQPLVRDGLVQIDGRVVTATEAGRAVVRVIAAVFDSHTRQDAARFSKAV